MAAIMEDVKKKEFKANTKIFPFVNSDTFLQDLDGLLCVLGGKADNHISQNVSGRGSHVCRYILPKVGVVYVSTPYGPFGAMRNTGGRVQIFGFARDVTYDKLNDGLADLSEKYKKDSKQQP